MKKFSLLFFIVFVQCYSANAQFWSLTGNASTGYNNFIGTTNTLYLGFRVNNRPSGMMDSSSRSTFFGFGAFSSGIAESLSNNTGFGHLVMVHTHGGGNTAVGAFTLTNNTDGGNNTAIGVSCMTSNIGGTANTAVGSGTMYNNTTGDDNSAVGEGALAANTIGSSNSALGDYALRYNISGGYNSSVGGYSMYSNTSGGYNNVLGYEALYNNTTGSSNTAIGNFAMVNSTTGIANSSVGGYAMASNTTGTYNTGTGYASLYYTTASYYNTAMGYNSGGSYNHGWNNTFLGANTRTNGANYYNVIAIGQDVTCTGVNQVRIGNTATSSIGGYAYWTNFSDGRYKKDVKEDVKGLEFIMQLRPVTYHLDVAGINKKLGRPKDMNGKEIEADANTKKSWMEKEQVVTSGFIAQEVETAAKKVGYDFDAVDRPKNENDFYGLRYAEFVVPLVKGMQEQQQQIAKQQEQIDLLKKEIDLLKEQNKILMGVTKTN